ncbi:unnamed protein product, partial [Owenia fusiformis]
NGLATGRIFQNASSTNNPECFLRVNEVDCVSGKRSCKERCGWNVSETSDFYCQCDAKCADYGDCCSDYIKECVKNRTTDHFIDIRQSKRGEYKCLDVGRKWVYLRATCLPEYRGMLLDTDCHNSNGILGKNPVEDVSTGEQYKNIHCALCNNVNDTAQMWKNNISCPLKLISSEEFQHTDLNTMLMLLTNQECHTEFIAPNSSRNCVPFEYTCTHCLDTGLLDRCAQGGLQGIVYQFVTYYNWNCILCNHHLTQTPTPRELCSDIRFMFSRGLPYMLFSLQILVDMVSKDNYKYKVNTEGEIFGMKKLEFQCDKINGCKANSCPMGFAKKNASCVLVQDLVEISLTLKTYPPLVAMTSVFFKKMSDMISQVFKPLGFLNKEAVKCKSVCGNIMVFTFNITKPPDFKLNWTNNENVSEMEWKVEQYLKDLKLEADVLISHKLILVDTGSSDTQSTDTKSRDKESRGNGGKEKSLDTQCTDKQSCGNGGKEKSSDHIQIVWIASCLLCIINLY